MKKLIKVTVQHQMLVDIPDHLTTEEFLQLFSEDLWEVKEANELFKHVAECAVKGHDFADGMGAIIDSDSEYVGIKVDKAEPIYNCEIKDFDAVELAKHFVLFHHYDIGDRSVLFTHESLSPEQVTELAIYLQFKAEQDLDDSVMVDNLTAVEYLQLHGAVVSEKRNDDTRLGKTLIDMHFERQNRCGEWFKEKYQT